MSDIRIKTTSTVHGVEPINRSSFKFTRFEELIRFEKNESIFKQWGQTKRVYKTKLFANGFIHYDYP